MEWYKKFGFKKNPFELNPLNSKFDIIGRDSECEEIIYRIASGNMLLIEGKAGTGKTTMLMHAIDNFRGKGKVIYVNAAMLNKRLDIAKLIHKKPKGMILLLDNVQYLSAKNNDKIKFFYDQDRIKSVVFTTNSYGLVNFSDSIQDRIGMNIIKLKNFNQSTTLEIARDKLKDADFIPDVVLKKIYDMTNNIKDFFKTCVALGIYLEYQEKEIASLHDLKNLDISEINEEKESETEICKKCHEELIKVGNYWRCKNCDQYCMNCGALVEDDDNYCPECGVEFEEE
jgi:Cdc6-like AAA superfamily ATPase/RNA polymerase subunit RPABC4/transcription elongation factor Spt4